MKSKLVILAWLACLAWSASSVHAQKLTWNRIWGTSNVYTCAEAVAHDASSNLFVAGTTWGTFDAQTNAGGQDAFLTKIDRYGNRQWSRIWGSASNEAVTGVTVDRKGCIYVTGHTPGAFHGETNTGYRDFFLTKWRNDGTWLWTRIWGSSSEDLSAGVVVNSVDWPHVAGSTMGNFGGQTNSRLGSYDFCLSAFSTNGTINPQTIAIWGSTNSEQCTDVAMNSMDQMFLVGTMGRGVFEGITNTFPYNRLVISACDLGGGRYWSAVWGATNKHNDAQTVWAGNSTVYAAGWTFGPFDGQPFNTNFVTPSADLFISQFSTGGTKNWTRLFGSTSWEHAYGVAADAAGNAYVTGQTGASTLDGQPSAGGSDYFLIKYDSAGNRQWTRLWGSARDDDAATDIVVDPVTNVFVCGSSYGSFGGQLNPGQAAYQDCATLSRWRMGANTPPQPVILKPLAGRDFITNELVNCIGHGLDLDDGLVTNLAWALGSGSGSGPTCTVSAAVAPGSRSVMATVSDTEGGSRTGTVTVTILAAGSEGLPQAWEQTYWPADPSGGGTNDSDGDLRSNWEEWLAGTNPTNRSSVFRIENPGLTTNSVPALVLQWSSISNREYEVWFSTNLVDGFAPLTNLVANPPLNVYTTPASTRPDNFYTIRVGR